MKPAALLASLVILNLAAACGGDAAATPDEVDAGDPTPPASEDWERDLLHTSLEIDLQALTGRAIIDIAGGEDTTGASFEIGDLSITSVTGPGGAALEYTAEGGELHLGVPDTGAAVQVTIDYALVAHAGFDGWDPASGLTFVWPYFCSNLFPCKSAPSEGQTFSLAFTGTADGAIAIYPAEIESDAPSYMPAIAVGDFTEVALGTTTAGTEVSVWHLPGDAVNAAAGTEHLVDVFDFYEQTYGDYTFGDKVGTVSANWGESAYGGMEHHPFWHVGQDSLRSEDVNAHEAAHGWYGNGVRIACWEDFVLSEGVATYLSLRALAEQGVDMWPNYECSLKDVCGGDSNTIVMPATCGVIDIHHDPLWSYAPYAKGAFFLKEVADLIGEAEVDEVLADFYQANVGRAAEMEDLLEALAAKVPAQTSAVDALAGAWLSSLECPVDLETLCPG